MIGSLIGTGLSAISSIFGGLQASKAMKKYKSNVEAQQKKNNDWYNRRYNEDATQRGDAQRILTQTEEAIKNRNRNSAGTQAVMGGTEESVAASKAANAQAMADAASQITAAGEKRKDAIEAQYQAKDDALQEQLNNLEVNRANAIAQATQGAGQALGSLGSGVDDWLDGVKTGDGNMTVRKPSKKTEEEES